jgi:hypothetical protein
MPPTCAINCAVSAIQTAGCFISYSSKDDEFANRIHADLQNSGVRCWFAPHDLRRRQRMAYTAR